MFRKKVSKKQDKKMFHNTAKKVHKKNITRPSQRGGIKL